MLCPTKPTLPARKHPRATIPGRRRVAERNGGAHVPTIAVGIDRENIINFLIPFSCGEMCPAFSPTQKRWITHSHIVLPERHDARCASKEPTTETRYPEPSHRRAKNVEGIWIRDVVFRRLWTRVEFEATSQSSSDSYLYRDEDVIHREREKHVATDEEEEEKKKRENERDDKSDGAKRTRRADDDRYFRRDWFRRQTLD